MRVYDRDDHIELAVIGRNLTNKYYKIAYNDIPFGPPTGGQLGGVAARPREVVIQVQYKF
jgi:iron complex outermembrane receptor protein